MGDKIIVNGEEFVLYVENNVAKYYFNRSGTRLKTSLNGTILEIKETKDFSVRPNGYIDSNDTFHHRIIAKLFVPGRTEEKNYVNHINGIKTDNRAENLEWVSAKENSNHARENLDISLPDLAVHGFIPVKNSDNSVVWKLKYNFKSQSEAERATGIDSRRISDMLNNTYKNNNLRKDNNGNYVYWVNAKRNKDIKENLEDLISKKEIALLKRTARPNASRHTYVVKFYDQYEKHIETIEITSLTGNVWASNATALKSKVNNNKLNSIHHTVRKRNKEYENYYLFEIICSYNI